MENMSEEEHNIKFKEEASEKETAKVEEEKKPSKKKSKYGTLGLIIMIIIALVLVAYANGNIHILPRDEPTDTNHAPEIKYHYDIYRDNLKGNITFVVGVEDDDNDRMNIQFWVKETNTSDWVGIGNFEGNQMEYSILSDYIYKLTNTTTEKYASWRVDVSDGKKTTIATYVFKYTAKW